MLASVRFAPAQHDVLRRDHRRPLTSCAHRLRKPHRAFGPLTLSVARRPPKGGLLSSPRARHPSVHLAMNRWVQPPRQARPDRCRFRTAASFGPERLLSDRPGPRSPGGHDHVCFLHLHGPAQHPFACRDPGPPRQGSGGRFRLPRAALARSCDHHPWRATRKMRLTDFCNRLTTRAPCGSVDSRALLLRALRPSGWSSPAGGRSHLRYPEWSFA